MAYTSFSGMSGYIKELTGLEGLPAQPDVSGYDEGNDLKSAALRFIHRRCEGLLFDEEETAEEERTGVYRGSSLKAGQIPYNMQMDINRLCLARELETFIDSGVAEDAYNVYYCYLEMFFGHYGKSKKMVELLSEFESNGSSLLMKHRDHYSHSVYVFALGLAIYETNGNYRKAFADHYGYSEHEASLEFLKYWGLASLFHDIGYPFELPFEQILSYYEVDGVKRGDNSPFLAYRNVEAITKLSEEERAHFKKLFGRDFDNTDELFSFCTAEKLGRDYGFDEAYLCEVLGRKATRPDTFGFFMDHAYFSCVRLYREMLKSFGAENINQRHTDALTAVLIHNSIYKFAIAFYKSKDKRKAPLKPEQHPLAYLLMLCDELQCWDRTAYGRNSRTELHPMAADFDFSGNGIDAVYYFDKEEQAKIDSFSAEYRKWEAGGEAGDPPRLKAYSDMAEKEQRFTRDIEKIVDVSKCPLRVRPDEREADRSNKHTYLSTSNFLHLYDFAVALNARYSYNGREDEISGKELEENFESLSLEYQIDNINQAKSFAGYLDILKCFYTDKPVDYDMLTEFTGEQIGRFAPLEHERWVKRRGAMAWTPGRFYETWELPADYVKTYGSEAGAREALREQLRMNGFAMSGEPSEAEIRAHYDQLPEAEKAKDYEPFNSMLKLIKKFDGLRVYYLEA
ncbi:MAG: hypothetical protein K5796_03780 [Lachnospiraceae bacterium]|nr:hypothetical protein [Lachnospiraceae bacterium]